MIGTENHNVDGYPPIMTLRPVKGAVTKISNTRIPAKRNTPAACRQFSGRDSAIPDSAVPTTRKSNHRVSPALPTLQAYANMHKKESDTPNCRSARERLCGSLNSTSLI